MNRGALPWWHCAADGTGRRSGVAGRQGLGRPAPIWFGAMSICDIPASPAGARKRAMSRCDPRRIRAGASRGPTSENRNSISRARPRVLTFARHAEQSIRSFGSPSSGGKLTSICQPLSPGSPGWEAHDKHAPEAQRIQAPASLAGDLVECGVKHRRPFGLQERRVLVAGKPDGFVDVAGS